MLYKEARLMCIGTSFKTADIATREYVLDSLLKKTSKENIRDILCCEESTLIVTCNRIELYLVTSDTEKTRERFLTILGKTDEWNKRLYFYYDVGAVEHLLLVSCGLDSEAIFEEQIREQLIEANINERSYGNSKGVLSSLFDFCYNLSGKLRKIFNLPKGVSLATTSFESLEKLGIIPKKILLIGSGKIILTLSEKLSGKEVYIYTGRKSIPKELSWVKRVKTKDFKRIVKEVDLIISGTNKRNILKASDIDNNKKVILDLGFPRNIDESLGKLDNVRLYNLDSISNSLTRPLISTKELEKVIHDEAKSFYSYICSTKLKRTIPLIYIWAENIRKRELEKAVKEINKAENLETVLDAMSKSITSKILHPVVSYARKNGNDAILKEIFQGIVR